MERLLNVMVYGDAEPSLETVEQMDRQTARKFLVSQGIQPTEELMARLLRGVVDAKREEKLVPRPRYSSLAALRPMQCVELKRWDATEVQA